MSHNDRASHFLKSIVAGGGAGLIEVAIMYPLDLVKTQMQLNVGYQVKMGTFTTLGKIFRERGPLGIYRGIASPLLAEIPKRSIKFGCNELYKPFLEKTIRNEFLAHGLSGAAAGCTEALINCPFEVVKVRLQSAKDIGLYKNAFDATKKIIRQEGAWAFYKGLESHCIRNGIWSGLYFALIPYLNKKLWTPKTKSDELLRNFISGLIGGTVGTTFNTPFDVAKSRLQNQKGSERIYKNSIQTVAKIFREEGFRALYKGYLPRLYRLGPAGGIMIVAFDKISEWLKII